jgi:ketosteroid isomerase-like protein
MSDDAVEVVRALQPAPDVNLADLFLREADAATVEAALAAIAPRYTDDFVCILHALSSEERRGLEGLREAWLDWIAPWESYRAEIDAVTEGENGRVLVVGRDYGRRPGMSDEVELLASAVWTVRGDRVARAEFFTDRSEAYGAAGLNPAADGMTDRM